MKIYVDTSAFLAVLNAGDDFHSRAAAIWFDLLDQSAELITNSFVLVETHALVQNRLGLDAVRTLTGDIIPLLEVRWVDADLYQQAVNIALTANRRQLSLVDCSSFVVMRRDHIVKAFTFDNHFGEQGFEVLGDDCSWESKFMK
jgi:predicted nucleic acid-binding protein